MPKKRDDFWDYKIPTGMDDVERALDFLLWCAKRFPRRPVPITHVVRVALSAKKLPREDAKDVDQFRKNKMQRLRRKMRMDHNVGLVYHPGIGYRATVDEDDKVETILEKSRKHVQRAIAGLDSTQAMISESKIRAEHLKDRFRALTEASHRLNASSIQNRLAPPKEDAEVENS